MAKVRFEEIVPGTASLRAAYDAERRGLIVQIVCWWALAAFGVIITVATFLMAKGAAIVFWWGPIAIGCWQAPKAMKRLRQLDADQRVRMATFR